MQRRYLFSIVVVVVGLIVWRGVVYLSDRSAYSQFAQSSHPAQTVVSTGKSDRDSYFDLVAHHCPRSEELVKRELFWSSLDGRWESYTPSSAKQIISFLGAQWVGVKVGKIICLYQTDEAVTFPLALEQRHSQLVLTPKGDGWSALVDNRKLCKSASVADCPYRIQPPKKIDDVYEEIKYDPAGLDKVGGSPAG